MARAQLASSMCQTGPLLENVSTLFDAAVEVFVWAFIQKQDVYYTSMDVYREMILTVTASRTLILYYKMCTKPINSCGKWFSHTQWRYLELSLWWHYDIIDIHWHPISLHPAMPMHLHIRHEHKHLLQSRNRETETRERERERERETPKLWPSMAYQTVGVPLIFLALQRQALRSSRELNNVHRISSEEHLMKIL